MNSDVTETLEFSIEHAASTCHLALPLNFLFSSSLFFPLSPKKELKKSALFASLSVEP